MSSGRKYNCALCHCQMIICSCCDRGNIYCSECAPKARRTTLRQAGKRYQNTFRGKINHAKRQKRYRMKIKIVTHHGSSVVANSVLIAKKLIQDDLRCDFCGCKCDSFLRINFLTTSVFKNTNIRPQGP